MRQRNEIAAARVVHVHFAEAQFFGNPGDDTGIV